MTTLWAYAMRETHFTTIAALHKVERNQKVLRTTAIAAAF
jgi:hypothetical protein